MWILINPSMTDGALKHNGKALLSAEGPETCSKLCHKCTSNSVENNNLRAHHNTTHLHGRLSPLFTREFVILLVRWASSRAQWSLSHAPCAATGLRATAIQEHSLCHAKPLSPVSPSWPCHYPPTLPTWTQNRCSKEISMGSSFKILYFFLKPKTWIKGNITNTH